MAESVCALEWVGEGERCKSGGEAARGLGRPRIRPRDAQSLRACSQGGQLRACSQGGQLRVVTVACSSSVSPAGKLAFVDQMRLICL